jgi:transcriptional regulator with XRE-family HTH domain
MEKRVKPLIPLPVTRALLKFGSDIRDARRRRRIPLALMAERAAISKSTLVKIERGDPGVHFGHYATVLFILGFLSELETIADLRNDKTGLAYEDETLPRRIRQPRKRELRSTPLTRSNIPPEEGPKNGN